MMTVTDSYPESDIDYKQKYKVLKKRLKILVYEHECFVAELRKAQRKLLKVSQDRSFLLDRLLEYEKGEDSSGDSEATASTDSDADAHHRDGTPAKRRRVGGHGGGGGHAHSHGDATTQISSPSSIASIILAQAATSGNQEGSKKRSRPSAKRSKAGASKAGHEAGGSAASQAPAAPMTREELERHLEAKQNVYGIEKATASLPIDIFSNDNSNHASDPTGNNGTGDDEEEDLVIDLPH